MAKVKNINGTWDSNCKCESWLKHWGKFSKKTAFYCSTHGCIDNTDLVGAHVQKADSNDNNRYVIPLCKTHSREKGELEISDSTVFVSADKIGTCDKG